MKNRLTVKDLLPSGVVLFREQEIIFFSTVCRAFAKESLLPKFCLFMPRRAEAGEKGEGRGEKSMHVGEGGRRGTGREEKRSESGNRMARGTGAAVSGTAGRNTGGDMPEAAGREKGRDRVPRGAGKIRERGGGERRGRGIAEGRADGGEDAGGRARRCGRGIGTRAGPGVRREWKRGRGVRRRRWKTRDGEGFRHVRVVFLHKEFIMTSQGVYRSRT